MNLVSNSFLIYYNSEHSIMLTNNYSSSHMSKYSYTVQWCTEEVVLIRGALTSAPSLNDKIAPSVGIVYEVKVQL